jgi:organic hydroperoxide reductase OsmC/OhrA
MLTIIGIYCNEHGYHFSKGKGSVTKIMESSPRRIGKLVIALDLRGNGWDAQTGEKVARAAKACPVAKSVDSGIEIELAIQLDGE